MTIVPKYTESMLKDLSLDKNNAKRNRIQPTDVPILLNRRTFFRPKLSDHLPNNGAPISWKAG